MSQGSRAAIERTAKEVDKNPSDNVVALERRHLVELHDAGCTRAEVSGLLQRLFPGDPSTVTHIAADLHSYGEWAEDEA